MTYPKPAIKELTRRDEKRVALLQLNSLAPFHAVSQEDVTLFAGQYPFLIQGQVVEGWRDQPEDLGRQRRQLGQSL